MPDPRDELRNTSKTQDKPPSKQKLLNQLNLMSDRDAAELAYKWLIQPVEPAQPDTERTILPTVNVPAEAVGPETAGFVVPTGKSERAAEGASMHPPRHALWKATEPPERVGQRAESRVAMTPVFQMGSVIKSTEDTGTVPQSGEQTTRAEQPDIGQLDRERVFNYIQRVGAAGMPISPDHDIAQSRALLKKDPAQFTVMSEELMGIEEQIEALLYRKHVLEASLGASVGTGE